MKTNWFLKKNFEFIKTANGSKFAVECNWSIKISQNVKFLCFLFEKIIGFFGKFVVFFLKIAKCGKLALQCNWTSKNLQNVQKIGALKKKDGFISNKNFFQWKIAKDSKFAVQGDCVFESSQIFLNLFFSQVKYMGFLKKIDFFKNR